MGSSSSSLLDEAQTSSITARAEAELKEFVPYYRKQLSAARFSELENSLEPSRGYTLRLRHKDSPQGEVLYEEPGLVLDHNRKWRERYLVVRGGYRLENHEGLESFLKGVPPLQVLLPSGGSVWTSLDSYVDQIQRSFPDLEGVEEEFSGFSGFSGSRFLVFLRLPHRRDSVFSFKNQDQRDRFCRILHSCIRHQNHDFLRRRSLEVEAFLRAVRFYREDRGRYRAGNLLIGSDVRVLSGLVMERLLPELQADPPAGLRTPRGQKTRMWLQFLEDVHVLLDSVVLDRFSQVKQDLRDWIGTLEPSMTSDLDLIRESRRSVRDRVRACVSTAAQRLATEKVVPNLRAMLMAILEPVSEAFLQGRSISHDAMEVVCQSEVGGANIKKLIASMPRANLQRCYEMLGQISNKLMPQGKGFGFSDVSTLMLIDGACLHLQQLVENAAFTFQQILLDEAEPDSAHKAKHRVLQHFDYDSSILRKKIVLEALISVTLPYVKEQLDHQYKTELSALQRSVDSDSAPFVAVENEYEDVLVELLSRHATEVLTDPANLERFHLLPDPVQEKTTGTEPGPEPVRDSGSLPQVGLEIEPGPESESVPDPTPEAGSEPESGPELGLVPDPGPHSTPDSRPEPEQEDRPEPTPRPEPVQEPTSLAEGGLDKVSGPDPGSEPELEPGPEPVPGPGSEPEPEPAPETSDTDATLASDCVRAIGELVVLAHFPDVVQLDN